MIFNVSQILTIKGIGTKYIQGIWHTAWKMCKRRYVFLYIFNTSSLPFDMSYIDCITCRLYNMQMFIFRKNVFSLLDCIWTIILRHNKIFKTIDSFAVRIVKKPDIFLVKIFGLSHFIGIKNFTAWRFVNQCKSLFGSCLNA